MNILAIETSCDETSLCILQVHGTSFSVLSHLTHSQIQEHQQYGGVYPSLAKREHAKNITPLLTVCLKESEMYVSKKSEDPELPAETLEAIHKILSREAETATALVELLASINKPDIDYIAVTQGPGLEPALWVGINVAKVLGLVWNIPVLPINHMEGHIVSVLYQKDNPTLKTLTTPVLALLVSGGHTELVLIEKLGSYSIIGKTRDDAVGEAFDKTARLLGLPYPGGPEISKLASQGGPTSGIVLPRPMLHSGDYDFSFSGLKTAVRYLVQSKKDALETDNLSIPIKSAIAYEFQNAVTEVLLAKTKKGILETGAKALVVAGGVSANTHLRKSMLSLGDELSIPIFFPDKEVTGDNALMIALAGYFKLEQRTHIPRDFSADGNLSL